MNQPNNPEEIGGVLNRINQLGAATERLFSRVYTGLNRRARDAEREQRRIELTNQIEQIRDLEKKNQNLKQKLNDRSTEIGRLHGILSALNEGFIMQDNEGRIVFMNDAARKLLGTQKNFWESELGRLFNDFRHITEVSSELVPLGEPNRIQTNNRILGAQLAAVADTEGQRLGTMIILRDVTHDSLADRLKDQFVTAISHELKTPMTVIKGMSEVLMGSPADQPPNRRLLETLSRNVDILDRMVVELLDVSEMGAGTFDIRQKNLNLENLLWSVVNGLAPEIKKSKLDVIIMTKNTNKLQIIGDDQRLRWALGHIVQNSINYTESGGHIIISIGIDPQNSDFVVIDVMDTGVGISEKDSPHVFERFYRGDPRNSAGKLIDPRGLGQGLFVAKTVAEIHGGYLRVESEIGLGSQFKMALPSASNN